MALKYLYLPSGVKAGTAYGVLPNSASADFDFTRSSAGSRVDENGFINTGLGLGSEEIVNGDFDSASNWEVSVATISNGRAIFISATNAYSYVRQVGVLTQNKEYEVTINLTVNSGSGIKLQDGSGTTFSVISESGIHTRRFTATTTNSTFVMAREYDSDGYDMYIESVSVREITEVNTDVPRLDYTGGGCPSLLLEPASTNKIGYSEDFTQSYWSEGGQIRTYGFSSPEGRYNACLIQKGSGGYMMTGGISLIDGQTYTFSFYAKRKTDTTVLMRFQERGGDYTSYAYKWITLTDEWKRYELTGTKGSDTNQARVSIDGIGVGEEFYIYGAQLEQQSYATSYIPTFGAASTRSAETCNNAGDADTFNDSEGVLMVEISALSLSDTSSRRIGITKDGTYEGLRVQLGDNNISATVFDGASNQYSKIISYNNEIPNKIALKYKANDFALWINGMEYEPQSSGSTFVDGTLNDLSFDYVGGSDFYGNTKQIQYFDTALTDSELEELTKI